MHALRSEKRDQTRTSFVRYVVQFGYRACHGKVEVGFYFGVKIPKCESVFKLSAYADGVAVLVNGQQNINIMLKVFHEFTGVSSAKINWPKSIAVLVGQWLDGEPRLPDGLSPKKGGFKYLGVFIGDYVYVQKNLKGWFK